MKSMLSFPRLALVGAMALAACDAPTGGTGSASSAEREQADHYAVKNLVSDDPKVVPAAAADPNLINGWGLAASATGPWWTSNNGTGTSSLYNGAGAVQPRLFSVSGYAPGADKITARGGQPTGIVFHNAATGKLVTSNGLKSGPAVFIFANEDGTISGWNPALGFDSPVMIDHHKSGAVYKGLAILGDTLYATNFAAGTVEVYDGNLHPVSAPGAFARPRRVPAGFAPYGIQVIGKTVVVTYAKQDEAKHDEVKGEGLGAVVAFDAAGKLLRVVAVGEKLNAPWGVALAPVNFGRFSGSLLVGQFGDGSILAFDLGGGVDEDRGEDAEPVAGEWLETDDGRLVVDGLWGLAFGYGSAGSGPTNSLYFAAGPKDETHGLFGVITVAGNQ